MRLEALAGETPYHHSHMRIADPSITQRSRQIYCSAPPDGLLAGTPVDKNHCPLARLSVIHIARNGKESVSRKVDPG